MPIRKMNPTSAGTRGRSVVYSQDLSTVEPHKKLLSSYSKNAGRNNTGRITVRHRGGGVRKLYRMVDFLRDKDGVPAVVKTIEYDPNRSVFISLVQYKDGEKRYILAPNGLTVGTEIMSGSDADIKVGNNLALRLIPTGTEIHNLEMTIGKGAQLIRSAGSFGIVMAKGDSYATIKMPSGEVRLVNLKCKATIGQLCNSESRNGMRGKAGATRWKGFRPSVRGSVMNACDHPHGGGEGKAPIGRPGPLTPWGKPTLGYKTRNKKKHSSKYILTRRR